jgi:hypothetical protein
VEKVSGAWGERLVCFMVPRGIRAPFFALLVHAQELDLLEATIRSRLRETLPSGWIPSHFVFVTQVPLNVSDKVDRARLIRAYEEQFAPSLRRDSGMGTPLADEESSSREQTEIRPARDVNSMSHTIRKIWARVLGMDEGQVGEDVDFLRLGGSSLHAIRVVSAMRAQGLVASTAQILSNATVRELAVCCLSEAQSQARIAACDNEDPPPFSLL